MARAVSDLPQPELADDAQGLAPVDMEGNALHGVELAGGHRQGDPQILHRQNALAHAGLNCGSPVR